jgi:DNA invertase Pin-like site-specific DNA recombinase
MNELPCVIYAAKSTEDVRGSIATQLEDCRRAIEREGGRRAFAERSDESASAFRGSRGPGLVAAKRDATQFASRHGAAELWVQHSDRLARGDGLTADHLAEVYFEMRRAKVQVRSVEDDGTFTNPMLVAAIGERNREDSARKSLATRAGKRRRWKGGKVIGGPVHDGYKLAAELDEQGKPITERDGRVVYKRVTDPERAPIIERILAMVEAGHSPGAVARSLNQDGLRTAYGERSEGDHEALIEHERWERIVAGLKRPDPVAAQRRRQGRRPAEEYLLRANRLLRGMRTAPLRPTVCERASLHLRGRPPSPGDL